MSMNNFENKNNVTSMVCDSHDYNTMKPIMVASWRLGSQSPSRSLTSGIITETRVLQEVLLIPNANVKLVYHSGRARGYLSTIGKDIFRFKISYLLSLKKCLYILSIL